MTTFIMTGKISNEAAKLVSAERTEKANEIFRQCGGHHVRGYATLGDVDFVVFAEFPGVNEAMKASVELNRALGISFATMPALAIDDFDKLAAAKP